MSSERRSDQLIAGLDNFWLSLVVVAVVAVSAACIAFIKWSMPIGIDPSYDAGYTSGTDGDARHIFDVTHDAEQACHDDWDRQRKFASFHTYSIAYVDGCRDAPEGTPHE